MSFILGDTTLPEPNEFYEDFEVGGKVNITLKGGRKRAIKYKKKTWTLRWNLLTQSQYSNIKTEYDKDITLSFTNSDLSISETVHMDLIEHRYRPGSGDYISGVIVTLKEV